MTKNYISFGVAEKIKPDLTMSSDDLKKFDTSSSGGVKKLIAKFFKFNNPKSK